MKDDTTVNARATGRHHGRDGELRRATVRFPAQRHRERGGHGRESAGGRCVRRRVPGGRHAVSRDGDGARRGGQRDAELRPRSDSRRRAPRDAARRAGRRCEPRGRGDGRVRLVRERCRDGHGFHLVRGRHHARRARRRRRRLPDGRRRHGPVERAHRPLHSEPFRRGAELAVVRARRARPEASRTRGRRSTTSTRPSSRRRPSR